MVSAELAIERWSPELWVDLYNTFDPMRGEYYATCQVKEIKDVLGEHDPSEFTAVRNREEPEGEAGGGEGRADL